MSSTSWKRECDAHSWRGRPVVRDALPSCRERPQRRPWDRTPPRRTPRFGPDGGSRTPRRPADRRPVPVRATRSSVRRQVGAPSGIGRKRHRRVGEREHHAAVTDIETIGHRFEHRHLHCGAPGATADTIMPIACALRSSANIAAAAASAISCDPHGAADPRTDRRVTHLSLRFGQRTQVHSTLSSIACHL